MDQIYTSAAALTRAKQTLKELVENITRMISNSETKIRDQFGGIDQKYQNELVAYFEALEDLKNQLSEFEKSNNEAICDRLNRLSEYTSTAYKQRNIL